MTHGLPDPFPGWAKIATKSLGKSIMLWVFVISLVVLLLVACQAYAAKNYLDPNAPFFSGNYAAVKPGPVDTITVVAYNIRYALNIDKAILEIRQIESRRGLDILLLQEMDEAAADQIARAFQLNYVFYPATVEPTHHKNFGNAVLSRWPIVDSQKFILPHISLSNRMKRAATRATILIGGEEIIAYSIHTEPVFILPHFKVNQYTAVLSNFDSESRRIIVGGDFNTFSERAIEKMVRHYCHAGLERASVDVGYTFVRWRLKMSPDHIFAKGFTVKGNGKLAEATASDHLPIWVTLMLKKSVPSSRDIFD